jgi:hypothetical protein
MLPKTDISTGSKLPGPIKPIWIEPSLIRGPCVHHCRDSVSRQVEDRYSLRYALRSGKAGTTRSDNSQSVEKGLALQFAMHPQFLTGTVKDGKSGKRTSQRGLFNSAFEPALSFRRSQYGSLFSRRSWMGAGWRLIRRRGILRCYPNRRRQRGLLEARVRTSGRSAERASRHLAGTRVYACYRSAWQVVVPGERFSGLFHTGQKLFDQAMTELGLPATRFSG